jgi:hypothetical protein
MCAEYTEGGISAPLLFILSRIKRELKAGLLSSEEMIACLLPFFIRSSSQCYDFGSAAALQ